jgi:hypothetical protein
MRHIVSVAFEALHAFSTLYHKRHDLRKDNEYEIVV